ncbi:four helix bundle protein [Candidatus Gracilibacteria bacterium]|nr:four helix bundle protein [Candidatus Gracilibacteria bacterium]
MKKNIVLEKSFLLAIDIVHLVRTLTKDREYVISKQLLKCGTSIGANIEEALSAESKKDFLHKLLIATKEARETAYWLRLLQATGQRQTKNMPEILAKNDEVLKLLMSITKTLKTKLNPPPPNS